MKKKHLRIIAILVSLIFIAISNCNCIFALTAEIWSGATKVSGVGTMIISAVQWIAIAVLVGAAIAKGIKFVSSSPEGKADVKKEITMFLIGAVIIFGVGQIIRSIFKIVLDSNLYG